jgi:hypothetical protein
MKSRVQELIGLGDRLFAKRSPLLSRWQDMADHFYPERGDFTTVHTLNTDFAGHLMTSVPTLARRDLANAFSYMLRPRGQAWFIPRTGDEKINDDQTAVRWLDWCGEVMRRAMYDPAARFIRCTKEGDNDFATFGQAVITIDLNRTRDALLYRCWHLRDVVWCENEGLEIDTVHRKGKLPARDLVKLFPKTADAKLRDMAEKDPYNEVEYRHIVMPYDNYETPGSADEIVKRKPMHRFVSIYVDTVHETILEEVPQRRLNYIIPRWQTVSGSQYAHSPATVIAIPDARLLQRMTLTLLEAGEKAVDPPLVGQADVVRGGVNTYAGAVTWVDAEYDERFGEALRPMSIDKSGLQFGIDREERITQMIHKAFFLDQLELPQVGADKMTAYETQIRMEEYMRRALPLFEPMESEYNGQICDMTFDILMEQGTFGGPGDIPESLQGQEIKFQFESPIQAAASRANAKAFQDSMGLLQMAAQLDPASRFVFDTEKGLRDAMEGAGAPSDWIRTDEEINGLKQEEAQKAQLMQIAQAAGAAGQVAQEVGKGGEAMMKGGMAQPQDMQGMMQQLAGAGQGGQGG